MGILSKISEEYWINRQFDTDIIFIIPFVIIFFGSIYYSFQDASYLFVALACLIGIVVVGSVCINDLKNL